MRFDGFTIEVDDDGLGFALTRDGEVWARLAWSGATGQQRLAVDEDEIEHSLRMDDWSLVVRHAGGPSWSIRWVLTGPPGTQVPAPALRLAVDPASGYAGWVWAAGSEGLLVLAPRTRPGPVVALRLVRGWLEDVRDGFRLVPEDLILAPEERWVGLLRAESYPTIAAVAATVPAWLRPLELTAGQPWEFADPDRALVVHPPATSSMRGDVVEVLAPAGRTRLEVRSPRGITRLTLSVSATLEAALAHAAAHVLDHPDPLTGAAAYVLFTAAQRNLVAQPSAARAKLDGFGPQQPDDLLSVAFGILSAQHQGDAGALRAGVDRLARMPESEGYARLVTMAWIAGMSLGEHPSGHSATLLRRGCHEPWVALEQTLLTEREDDEAEPTLQGLINSLGGDLPGHPLAMSPVAQARRAGLLMLCPERWSSSRAAADCAVKTERRLLAELAPGRWSEQDLRVLAWLTFSRTLV